MRDFILNIGDSGNTHYTSELKGSIVSGGVLRTGLLIHFWRHKWLSVIKFLFLLLAPSRFLSTDDWLPEFQRNKSHKGNQGLYPGAIDGDSWREGPVLKMCRKFSRKMRISSTFQKGTHLDVINNSWRHFLEAHRHSHIPGLKGNPEQVWHAWRSVRDLWITRIRSNASSQPPPDPLTQNLCLETYI